MSAIIITGVPGVGKTTVVTEAARRAGVAVVVYGTQMLEVARAKGLVKDRDELRRLPPDTQREVQKAAAESIAEKGKIIVDTHGTIQTARGFLPGIPQWVAEKLKPAMIVLIEADPEAIAARRAFDETRKRDEDSVEAIELHQQMNRAAAMTVAVLTGATVLVVRNEEGGIEDAAERLAEAMR